VHISFSFANVIMQCGAFSVRQTSSATDEKIRKFV